MGRWTLFSSAQRWPFSGISLLFLGAIGSACSPPGGSIAAPRRGAEPNSVSSHGAPSAPLIFSPQLDGSSTSETGVCGLADAGLRRAALRVLGDYERTGILPNAETLTARVRSEGLPYVWVRAWAAVAPDSATLERALGQWSGGVAHQGRPRCGVALSAAHGSVHAVALMADVLADVSPLPRTGRVGQWLALEAQLHVEVHDVQLLALGPRGLPHRLPVQVTENGVLHARLPLASPGRWLFQVLPDTPAGPRPVAELEVFVDVSAAIASDVDSVPGEREPRCGSEACESEALATMLNAARVSEGLTSLIAHAQLEQLATKHARSMAEQRQLAHDLGQGDAYIRVTTELPSLTSIGENVAHAASVRDAHRALWRSPAHRLNMLHRDYTHIGVGVAHGANGEVWTCQLFASEPSDQ